MKILPHNCCFQPIEWDILLLQSGASILRIQSSDTNASVDGRNFLLGCYVSLANFILLVILFGAVSLAQGQYKLDESFKDNGTFLYAEETKGFIARDILVETNEILVVGGERKNPGINAIVYSDSALVIYKLDKSGDFISSFGNEGRFYLKFDTPIQVKEVQTVDNFYFVSLTSQPQLSFRGPLSYLVKIKSNGILDSSFATDGVKTFDQDPPENILLDSSFAFFGVRTTGTGQEATYILEKYTPDAVLDTLFGNSGSYAFNVPFSVAEGLLFDGSGEKIYIVGTTKDDFYQYSVLRLLKNGSIDNSYGIDGLSKSAVFESNFGILDRIGFLSASLHNGSLFIGGLDRSENVYHICALKENGDILQSYGDSGLLNNSNGRSEDFFFTNADELALISGSINEGHEVSLLDTTGSLIPSFGDEGTLLAPICDFCNDITFTVAALEEGFIVAGISVMHGDSMALSISKFKRTETSITDMESPKSASIFPNPAQNTLHLPQELSAQNLKLYNSQGQHLNAVQPNPGQLDVSHLAPGMYVLQAGEQVWRFVKE